MQSGNGFRVRWTGWIGGIAALALLLVGISAASHHEAHPDGADCTLCQLGHENAEPTPAADISPSRAVVETAPGREADPAPAPKRLRRPARAPPE